MVIVCPAQLLFVFTRGGTLLFDQLVDDNGRTIAPTAEPARHPVVQRMQRAAKSDRFASVLVSLVTMSQPRGNAVCDGRDGTARDAYLLHGV